MRPVRQKNEHDPANGVWGDCHRAAVASVLELPIEEVPHFGEGGPEDREFFRRERAFFATRGLLPISVPFGGSADAPLDAVLMTLKHHARGAWWLLGGRSPRGFNHTVVGFGGEIVHDPNEKGGGVVGPRDDGFYWVTFFAALDPASTVYWRSTVDFHDVLRAVVANSAG